MRLLEIEAKNLLSQCGVKIPYGILVDENYEFNRGVVLKIQVPTGRRGKDGGVVKVSSLDEFEREVGRLKNLVVDGFRTEKILAEELVEFANEHYLALIVNRDVDEIQLIARREGGVDVEESDETPLIFPASPERFDDVAKKLCSYFNYDVSHSEKLRNLIAKLYDCMIKNDALLLEINPLVFSQNEFVALDCKMEIDDNSLFRHPEFAKVPSANFVTLDSNGNVAVVANGAGLSMATVDQINGAGLESTNFLDIGGGADAAKITANFAQFSQYKNLRAIIVNVFAGITRCDQVAEAILAAKNSLPDLPPIFIRLHGTNFTEAKSILDAHDIPLCVDLNDCIELAKEVCA